MLPRCLLSGGDDLLTQMFIFLLEGLCWYMYQVLVLGGICVIRHWVGFGTDWILGGVFPPVAVSCAPLGVAPEAAHYPTLIGRAAGVSGS